MPKLIGAIDYNCIRVRIDIYFIERIFLKEPGQRCRNGCGCCWLFLHGDMYGLILPVYTNIMKGKTNVKLKRVQIWEII